MEKQQTIKRSFLIEITDKGKSRQIDVKRINFGHHDLIGILLDMALKLITNPNIGQEKEKPMYIG